MSSKKFWELLNNVIDPELGIGIVDLGLIYDVKITNGHAIVTMTLTSMGCPVGPSIIHQVEEEMEQVAGVEEVTVKLVWEPAWTPDKMNPDVRAMLNL